MVTFLLSGGSRCSPVATCLFFVWLGHDSFMRHDLSVCLRVAHVIAHAPLFSRFTVLLLGFRSFLKSMCRLYMLVMISSLIPFSSIFSLLSSSISACSSKEVSSVPLDPLFSVWFTSPFLLTLPSLSLPASIPRFFLGGFFFCDLHRLHSSLHRG